MNKYNRKDKKRRENVYKKEKYRFILKNILKNNYFLKNIRLNALLKLTKLKKNSNPVSTNDRCVDSGKNNIVAHKFKFSRYSLIKYIRNGLVSGVRKTF